MGTEFLTFLNNRTLLLCFWEKRMVLLMYFPVLLVLLKSEVLLFPPWVSVTGEKLSRKQRSCYPLKHIVYSIRVHHLLRTCQSHKNQCWTTLWMNTVLILYSSLFFLIFQIFIFIVYRMSISKWNSSIWKTTFFEIIIYNWLIWLMPLVTCWLSFLYKIWSE